jgi:hypothetical protein
LVTVQQLRLFPKIALFELNERQPRQKVTEHKITLPYLKKVFGLIFDQKWTIQLKKSYLTKIVISSELVRQKSL